MNDEIDNSADVWARSIQDDAASKGEHAVKEESPPIAIELVCEAAEAGHYNQQLLTKLTGRDWADCTKALLEGLLNGMVDNGSGIATLTEKGRSVLDDARKKHGPMTTRAVARLAKTLDEQNRKDAASLDQAATEVRGVNDALDRLLASDDEGTA